MLSTSALAGLAGDRIGAPATGFLSFGLTLVGTLFLLALEFWPVRVVAYGYVLFLFLPIGSRATIVSMLVPRIAPPRKFGTVFGWLLVGDSLGAATGPLPHRDGDGRHRDRRLRHLHPRHGARSPWRAVRTIASTRTPPYRTSDADNAGG